MTIRWRALAVAAVLTPALTPALLLGLNAAQPAQAGKTATSPTVLTAVVNVDGTLARGIGAVSAQQTGADGEYQVTFSRDVSGCTYVATAGEAAPNTPGPDDAITFGVAPAASSVDTVFLLEYDTILARDSYSSGFHLIVVCP